MGFNSFKRRYYINGSDIFTNYGVGVTRGGMQELERMPKRKEQYVYQYKEKNGSKRFGNGVLLDERVVNLEFCLVFDSMSQYLERMRAFRSLLLTGELKLYCAPLEAEYTFLYNDNLNFDIPIGMFDFNGNVINENWVLFTIQFMDSSLVVDYGVKDYDSFFLLDENDINITDENNNFLRAEYYG